MAGLPLEDEEGLPRDDVPFDDVAPFEWLFEATWSDVDEARPDETGGFVGPSGAGREGLGRIVHPPSDSGSIAEHQEGKETAMVERPENQPEEPDTPEGEQGEQDPDAPEPGSPIPGQEWNPGPDSTTGEDGSGALHTGVPQ